MIDEQKIDNDTSIECCRNCKFFEERTCFCRLNPPTPMPTTSKGNQYMTAVYPKISYPDHDFCHQFVEKTN